MSKVLLWIGMVVLLVGCATATPTSVEPSPLATTAADAAPAQTSTDDPCYVQAVDYVAATEVLLAKLDESYTSRVEPNTFLTVEDVVEMIPELEAVRDEAAAQPVPPCAQYINDYLVQSIDAEVNLQKSSLTDDARIVTNYFGKQQQFYELQFLRGFGALRGELDLAAVPTFTPQPLIVGADDRTVSVPTTLVVVPSDGATDIDVRENAGGTRRDCRLAGGTVVNAVEASWDSAYIRIEGSDCDGWVVVEKLDLDS